MLQVSDISIEKLKNNELEKKLPEFYELKKIVENSDWHNNDSVFNHILNVLEKLEELLENVNDKINSYLNQKIVYSTRKELLFLGALFHDIAKKETIVKNNNTTSCQRHEEMGSKKVKTILERFDLSNKEKDIVARIVKYHGEIHNILDLNNENLEEQYEEFKDKRSDIFLELILLAIADTLGSQLNDNKPDEFNFRIDFYKK